MITIKVHKAKMGWEKIIGLIGKEKPYALLLKTRFGIHTFGLKHPIDVVIMNKNYTVQTLFPAMKPCRIFLWNPIYPYVLELPAGAIQKNKIKQGEKIQLVLQ